jgi:hypothetical protein
MSSPAAAAGRHPQADNHEDSSTALGMTAVALSCDNDELVALQALADITERQV